MKDVTTCSRAHLRRVLCNIDHIDPKINSFPKLTIFGGQTDKTQKAEKASSTFERKLETERQKIISLSEKKRGKKSETSFAGRKKT